MKKTNKKGFTIVELVIVIAVIAILAAVLIPNISRLVKKANESVDIQLVRNLNTALQLDRAGTKTYPTMHDALEAVREAGYDVAKLAKSDTDNVILWDSVNQCFALLVNGEGEPVYYPDTKTTEPENYQLWRVYDEMPAESEQTYSVYWIGESLTNVTVKGVGFDAGDKDVAAVKYEGLAGENPERKAVIRTNSYSTKVTVDAENDSVSHYDMAGDVVILNVKDSSYHEFGKVKTVKITNGHFVAEAGCELGSDVEKVSGGTATVDKEKAAIWGETEYKWSEDYSTCTATRKDKNGVKADETETVTAKVVEVKPTTTAEGSITYTATFTNPAFEEKTETKTTARLLTEEEQLLQDVNADLAAFEAQNNRKPATMHEALSALGNNKEKVVANAATLLWDSVENKFYTTTEVTAKVNAETSRKEYEFWKITKKAISNTYSNYLADEYEGSSSILGVGNKNGIRVGIDVGNNTTITEIKFHASTTTAATKNGNFIIRTNGNEVLTICSAKFLTHYGQVGKVVFSSGKYNTDITYVEKGIVLEFIQLNRESTIDLSGVDSKAARAVVIGNSEAIVIGNNKTPVCYTTDSKPSNISNVGNGNDIGRVVLAALNNYSEGFGTASNPFIINNMKDWSNISGCTATFTLYFRLNNNFTIETLATTVSTSAPVVLDLNGHTLTLKNDSVIQIGVKGLTIKDSVGNGSISKAETGGTRGLFASFDENGTTLTIEGGTFSGNYLVGDSVNADPSISVTVKGGTFKLDGFQSSAISQATIAIEGGTFNIDPTVYVNTELYTVTNEDGVWTVTKK